MLFCIQKKPALATQSVNHLSSRGFTLIEVITVLTLLAIVAVVVITRAGGTSMTVYADADRLVSDLRYAQSLAMTHAYNNAYNNGIVDQVTVHITSNGWRFDQNSTWRFADGEKTKELKWADSISDATISFLYPYGKLHAANNKDITLTKGEKTITVTVYAQTGYVEINQ